MSDIAVGGIGVGVMILLIMLRFHIGLAMGMVATVGIMVIQGPRAAFSILQNVPYSFAANWEFSAVPLFLLMGAVAHASGMTSSLFHAARLWLSWLPGGLAIATNIGCAGFSAAAGSSVVTSVAMGRIAVPEMLRFGYDKGLATGTVAAAGTLGVMIPPSIPMIIYAYFAEVSVGAMFLAGILPGLLTAALYCVMIMVRCTLNPALAPKVREDADPREKWRALADVWPLPVIIFVIVGTIYAGIASATESAAFGVVAAVLIALLKRKLTRAVLRDAIGGTIENTASIFFIILGAVLLTRFMAYSDLPEFISESVIAWGLSPLMLIIATGLIFLALGCILDPIGLMLLALPVFLPIYQAAEINMIWFGILFIKYIEIGLITPPVGMNVFILRSILPQIPVGTIFRGTGWFFVTEIVVVGLLIAFPAISLVLAESAR
ncbi:TRAP transporter large permease [Wenxinia marina]|uniref:TRAP transporter large permease protein n=1 Tax=Wenxinia marina DSM 24838 TaxID=1123501 RepID=A0A0D0QDC5_9RHOB|nr:TRAP transporter large permease subunit [Wenxinia marina]KIQ69003.1 TRAP transporter, DctM subunit [Wenxinia marina DSM 24838]GGL81044.1 C4-dicarboxylate ABC transporter [Wenxinia marina]